MHSRGGAWNVLDRLLVTTVGRFKTSLQFKCQSLLNVTGGTDYKYSVKKI